MFLITCLGTSFNSAKVEEPYKIAVRDKKGREDMGSDPSRVLTIDEKEWHKLQQATVLENVAKAFDGIDVLKTDGEGDVEDDNDSGCADECKTNKLSDGAEELAVMIQEQIESINRELR